MKERVRISVISSSPLRLFPLDIVSSALFFESLAVGIAPRPLSDLHRDFILVLPYLLQSSIHILEEECPGSCFPPRAMYVVEESL